MSALQFMTTMFFLKKKDSNTLIERSISPSYRLSASDITSVRA